MSMTQLYKLCPLCNGTGVDNDRTYLSCGACDTRGYVPHGSVQAPEDHDVLDVVLAALRGCDLDLCGISRESECVEFTDVTDGRRYEVVVREIDGEGEATTEEHSNR